MGLTSAMNTSATGLDTSQINLETIGDNIANINTTAFKSNRADFENLLALTLREGVGPGLGTGGVNPSQIGLGAALGAIQRSFEQGAISHTGIPSNLAIDGRGFFILEDASNVQLYTRDGSFTLDSDGQLVSSDGLSVQGYAADAEGNIDDSALTALTVPIATLTQVQATSWAQFLGNLDSEVATAASGAVQYSAPLLTASGPATEATPLTALLDDAGTALFGEGDVLQISEVSKGGFVLPPAQFVVGSDGSTLQDFMTFLEGSVAIHTDPQLGEAAGVTLDAGRLTITSNLGQPNTIEFGSASIRNTTAGTAPVAFDAPTASIGQGVTTSFDAFDSLGSTVRVRLRMIEIDAGPLGTTWQWYAESPHDSDVSNVVGAGTINFDVDGQFSGAADTTVSVNLAGSGAADPLEIQLDFSGMTGVSAASSDSEVQLADQDGRPFGTLESFAIGEDGIITGSFDNGHTSPLGQVALATFTNPNGLELATDNNFVRSPNADEPNITVPQESVAGRLESNALEMSNVDLAREFIGLIRASTGFSANSRVITTADELLQELLLIAR